MSSSQVDPGLAAEVARIRKAAMQHHKRTIGTLGASLIAGVIVGIAVWFVQKPKDRDEVHFALAAGLALATFVLGGLLSRMLFPRPRAECPECGCDWNIASENDVQTWHTWHCCPGCGLRMSDEPDVPDKS